MVEQALDDPELLYGLDRQLAAQLAVEQQLLERLGTGESGAAWRRLQRMGQDIDRRLDAITRLVRAGEDASDEIRELIRWIASDLRPVIYKGVGQEATRTELREHWDSRAKLLRARSQNERSISLAELALVVDAAVAQTARVLQRYLDDRQLTAALDDLKVIRLPRMVR
jgi:hypothetical protein